MTDDLKNGKDKSSPTMETFIRYFHGTAAAHPGQKSNVEAMYSVDVQPESVGGRLATAGNDSIVRLWKTESPPKLLSELTGNHRMGVQVVRWSPDGHTLASGSMDGFLVLWTKQEEVMHYIGQNERMETEESWGSKNTISVNDEIIDLSWSPSGKEIAVGSFCNVVFLFCAGTSKLLHRLDGHQFRVQGVCFDPVGKFVCTYGADASLKFYCQGKTKKSIYHPLHNVTHMVSEEKDEDGKNVKRKLFVSEKSYSPFFRRLDFSPCGRLLIVPAGQLPQVDSSRRFGCQVFYRSDFSVPQAFLNCPDGITSTVRFNPYAFHPRKSVKDLWLRYV